MKGEREREREREKSGGSSHFGLGQHVGHDQLALDGHERQVLESQKVALLEVVLGLGRHHPDQVLDADAEVTVVIEARLCSRTTAQTSQQVTKEYTE